MRARSVYCTVGVLGALLAGCREDAIRPAEPRRVRAQRVSHGYPGYSAEAPILETPRPSRVAPGWDSERLWSRHVDWEPAVAADPNARYVYQLTTRYYVPACETCGSPAIVFRRSQDGGRSFGPDRYLASVVKSQNDPQVEVARDGTIYVCYLQDFTPGVVFQKSVDLGLTWSEPIAVIGSGPPMWSDKPALAVSADGRDVYIGFNAGDAYVVVSHDGGASFEKPVRTNGDGRDWLHGQAAVAPNGDVYFTLVDFGPDYRSTSGIHVLRSSDGGRSFTSTPIDTSEEPPPCDWASGCYLGFLGPSTALAIDSSGRLMLAYNAGDRAGVPQSLWVRTSEDGVSWSPRRRVSTAGPRVNHAFPALASGPAAGDFRLVWQDDRQGPGRWNTWYRRTLDSGRTWGPAVRLSDVPSATSYKSGNGYRFPYGDYLDIAVDGRGVSHVIWGEGESYDGAGGSWFTRGHEDDDRQGF